VVSHSKMRNMNRVSNPDNAPKERVSNRDFLRSFFQDYKTVGAIRETSRGVAKRICHLADISSASRVAEFGCGTGPITEVILEELRSDGLLWGFEVHEPFVEHLRSNIRDQRFHLFEESATNVVQHRAQAELPPFDAVISTIPFSYLSHQQSTELLEAVIDTLSDDGRFVALQYHPTYLPPLLRRHFDHVTRDIYLWNVPPVNLFTATRPRRL
jgi:phosphatidylethanolamine/phosphatidyl-N-methylethanolamine N-methyltransferase